MALIPWAERRVAATREHNRHRRAHGRQRVTCSPAARAEPWLRHFRCSARDLELAVRTVGDDPLDVGVFLERRC